MALEELYTPTGDDAAELAALAKLAGEGEPEQPEPPEVQEIQEAQEPKQPDSDPFEPAARSQGWVPKEEWKGKPEHWVPAKDFVQNGPKINSLLRELGDVKANTTRMFAELRRQQEAEARRQQADFEAQRHAYEARIAELQGRKWDALEEGDITKARMAETELLRLRPPEAPKVQPQEEDPPEIRAFKSAVEQVHPDAPAIAASQEMGLWLLQQPALVQEAWQNPNPAYAIEVLNLFKRATGKVPRVPPNSPVAAPRASPRPQPNGHTQFNALPEKDRKDFQYGVQMGVYKDNETDRAAFAKAWAANQRG
jgi:hypothetical protein